MPDIDLEQLMATEELHKALRMRWGHKEHGTNYAWDDAKGMEDLGLKGGEELELRQRACEMFSGSEKRHHGDLCRAQKHVRQPRARRAAG